MKTCLVPAICILVLLSAGCKKKETALTPMGDAAPAMGTAGKADLRSFMVGDWCVVDPMSGPRTSETYSFKADGTFQAGVKDDWTCGGKWTVGANSVSLAYDTMNGKGFEDFRAEYKKGEEGGTQIAIARALKFDQMYANLEQRAAIWVDDDNKHLTFSDPKASVLPTGAGSPDMSGLNDISKLSKVQLERLESKTQ